MTPHILICDDDPVVHESLIIYLDAENYTHISAFDGLEALKLWESEKPDLIILDLMMPKMSAWMSVARFEKSNVIYHADRQRRRN